MKNTSRIFKKVSCSRVFTILTGMILTTGCAGFRNNLVLSPVGPEPIHEVSRNTPLQGVLVVYSAYEANPDFYGDDYAILKYTDYQIFKPTGELLRSVQNNTTTFNPDPVPVDLPPGKYEVKARCNGYGIVTIPIVIANHRSTVVHLGGNDTPWVNKDVSKSELVTLPDKTAVGWGVPNGADF